MTVAGATRCLFCHDAPCIAACPTAIDIPQFIRKIATGNLRGSARTILESNILGMSCARVCPVEVLCVGACVYNHLDQPPIAIGRLQRHATDAAFEAGWSFFEAGTDSGFRVALIGGGPASLAAAHRLRRLGHACTIFEAKETLGGLNSTGIAPYKLRADRSIEEVGWVLALGGIEVRTGVRVGEDVSLADLERDFDAVFVGVGLGADSSLGVPGEELDGVFGATSWIERMKLGTVDLSGVERAIVVGGGNTAIDVAREARGLGAADVAMVYRRGASEMSGYAHELEGARKEGVRFLEHRVPVGFVRDAAGALVAARLARTENGKAVAGTEHEVPCELVVVAIGQSKLRSLAKDLGGVELDARGCVVVDRATRQTGNSQVFAGGDCINGGKEVVNAVADGRDAARALLARWAAG